VTYLLDVNVLIALIDPGHVAHDDAHAWCAATGQSDWATCPLTENGVMRILGSTKYPNSPGSPAIVAGIVASLRNLPGHQFWGDDMSLVGSPEINPLKILTSAQVTDTCLLGLAAARGGRLATFDRKLAVTAVRGGRAALCLIPGN
jgi:toxin-antitoxin system PIN domain toxin